RLAGRLGGERAVAGAGRGHGPGWRGARLAAPGGRTAAGGYRDLRIRGSDVSGRRPCRRPRAPRRAPRGAALLLVLWLVALLAALVGAFAMIAQVEHLQGQVLSRGVVARQAARAGLEYALSRL